MVLFFLSFLACPGTAFSTSSSSLTGDVTVLSLNASGSEQTKFCLGESVTFLLSEMDFKGEEEEVDSIPWSISFNQLPIPEDELDQYLILDASVGASLNDWQQETELTFEPLQQGCYQVTVDPFIFFSTQTQNVGTREIVVADAPAKPELFGFDDVLMCDGGSIDGGFFSNTVGSVYMTLSHEWLNASGAVLDSLTLGTGSPTCDGPSLNGTFASGVLPVGTYDLVVESSNMCGDSSEVLEVEVVAFPAFALSSDPVCADDNATVLSDFVLADYAMADGTFPTPMASWSNGTTDLAQAIFASPQGGDSFTQTIELLYENVDGDGTLIDDALCESTADGAQVVHVPEAISIASTGPEDGFACDGAEVTLSIDSVSSADPVESYVWDPSILPSIPDLNSTSIVWGSFELDVTGTVEQTSVWLDGTTCVNDTSFSISVIEKPEISWLEGDDNICLGTDGGLSIKIESASTPDVEVVWALENGGTDLAVWPGANGIIFIEADNFTSAGQYPVLATPTDANGCVGDPIEGLVEVYPLPIPEAAFPETCEGESVVPVGVENGAAFDHAWTINGVAFSGTGANTAAPEFPNVACGDSAGLVLIQNITVDGEVLMCASDTLVQALNVVALAMPEVSPASPLCNGLDVDFTFAETEDGSGCSPFSAAYEWTFVAGETSLGHSGIGPFTFPAGTFEDIQVTVEAQSSGADGTVCPSTDAFVFTMTDNPEFADLPLDWLVCRDGELALEDNGVTSPNGSLVYSWNDTSLPQVFDIETDDPFASAATLSVQSGAGSASEGEVTLTAEDLVGCMASVSVVVDIWEPPLAGNLTVSTPTLCSGATLNLDLDGFVTDDQTNADAVTYEWEITASDGATYTALSAVDFDASVEGIVVPDAAFSDFSDPVALNLALTMSDGNCSSNQSWENEVDVYPNPLVTYPDPDDRKVCSGDDWTGTLEGPTSLTWETNPGAPEGVADAGGFLWSVPWSAIDVYTEDVVPVTYTLLASSDYGITTCTQPSTLELSVLENPVVTNLSNPDFANPDTAMCADETITSGWRELVGTGSGPPYTYSWQNADESDVFLIEPIGPGYTANISLLSLDEIPATGMYTFSIVDSEGCTGDTTWTVTIHELPEIGNLTVNPGEVCSEGTIELALDSYSVDDGLDASDATLTWSATLNDPAGTVTIEGNGDNVTASPKLPELPFQDFTGPDALTVELTIDIVGCESTASWDDVTSVYPNPALQADNNSVCAGESWLANLSGFQELTALGDTPEDNIVWTLSDAGIGVDIELSQDYIGSPSGGVQITTDFVGTVEYATGLTCSTQSPFQLQRRPTPALAVLGDDPNGAADDFVLCEGEDFILTASHNSPSGLSAAYVWEQEVDNGAGGIDLQTITNVSGNEAYLVDVEAEAPLDATTLLSGLATATYSYNSAPGFECVVETTWDVQVMPRPFVLFDLPVDVGCDGDTLALNANLVSGATSLNGESIAWEWAWDVSTFNEVLTTSDPTTAINFEAQYEDEVIGQSTQSIEVIVTDSYGCISAPRETSILVLERPEIQLDLPLACANDSAVEVVVSGGDVYTWNLDLDNHAGELENSVYFPTFASTGDSIQTLLFDDPQNGETVEVTGALVHVVASGEILTCSASTAADWIVYDMPTILAGLNHLPPPFCEGELMTFEDNGPSAGAVAYDYWTSSGLDEMMVTDNEIQFTLFSDSTTFEVVKYETHSLPSDPTNVVTCSVGMDTSFAVVPNPTVALAGNTGICQGDEGAVAVEVTNLDSGFAYVPTWFVSAGVDTVEVSGGFELHVLDTIGVQEDPTAPITFSVTVEDNNGCQSATETFNMDILAKPVLDLVSGLPQSVCSPSTECMQVDILNTGLDLNATQVTYLWGTMESNLNQFCDEYASSPGDPCPATREVSVNVLFTHDLGSGVELICSSSTGDTVVVNPTPEPEFSLEAPQACMDPDSANLIPLVHDTLYNICAGDSLSYQWFVTPLDGLEQSDLILINDTTPFPSLKVDTAGAVNVVLEIENSFGCSQTTSNASFTVRPLPVPELTFVQESVCVPTTVEVLNSSSGASEFSMSIPAFGDFDNFLSPLVLDVEFPGGYSPEFTLSNTHTIGDHDLTCTVDTVYSGAFEGQTPPVADFVVLPDTSIEFVDPVVEFINLSEGQTINIWSFGNGEGSSETDPEVEYANPGVYNVQLLVRNEYGCTDVRSQAIDVYTDLYVYVPTSFTPNNDGLNDVWAPSILGQDVISTYECIVFNRTGHMVFSSNDPNEPWLGENAVSGDGNHYTGGPEVFVWRIKIKKKLGQGAKVYEGHVTMIR